MKNALLLPIAAMAAGGCNPAMAGAPTTLESRTAEIARSMNTIAPKELGNGMTLASVSAEGRTLVMTIRGIEDWRPHNLSDAEIAKVLGASLCNQNSIRAAVQQGAAFRIDPITPAGIKLPGLHVCGSTPPA